MVPQFETCGKRAEQEENKVSAPPLTVMFSAFSKRVSSGYLVCSFLRTELAFLFSPDSLSWSVHCALDENDLPSEQTITFKLPSVYVPVYISELATT